MIRAADFLGACRRSGIVFFTGTPCSYMSPLFDAVAADDTVTFHAATNEGDAVAMAAGAYVATGRPGTVLFQNSGLGALTSLSFPFRLPALLVVGHRGQPGVPDEPQHALMGEITTELLDLLRIGCGSLTAPSTLATCSPWCSTTRRTSLRAARPPSAVTSPLARSRRHAATPG